MGLKASTSSLEICGEFVLPEFQSEAVHYGLSALDQGMEAALQVLPTGAGKTVIGSCIAALVHLQYKQRTLILIHKRELPYQWLNSIRKASPGITVSVVGDRFVDWSGDVVIASGPKLRKSVLARVDPRRFSLLIIDEAHHSSAPQWSRVMEYFRSDLRLGFSATPIRGDGICVAKDFNDAIIYMITLRRLIELGRLVNAKGYRVRTSVDLTNVQHTLDGDYDQKGLARAVKVERRNLAAVEAYLRHGESFPSIAFCVGVKHARDVAVAFNACKILACAGDGSMPIQEREELIAMTRAGLLPVLSNAALVHEGFDAPPVKTILLLRPYTECSARILLPQSVGRGLRCYGDHQYAVVLELVDEDRRHKRKVDLFEAFDIHSDDLDDVNPDGKLVSELAKVIQSKNNNVLRTAISEHVCTESVKKHLASSRLNGEVEPFDIIRVVEEVSGLRYLLIARGWYLPLTRDASRSPRFVEIRQNNGLYHATLVSSKGIEHLTAGADFKSVSEMVMWKLQEMGENTVFANPNGPWRKEPMTDKQRDLLAYRIGRPSNQIRDMTRGEASDSITMLEVINSEKNNS